MAASSGLTWTWFDEQATVTDTVYYFDAAGTYRSSYWGISRVPVFVDPDMEMDVGL